MGQDKNRRDFIKLASTVSAGIVLTGSTATISRAQEAEMAGPPPQTVEEQFDTWVELNIDNLNHNISEVRKKINGRPIMAVIKCNAYGHGIVEIAKSMALENIKHFAVVKMDEAEHLRHNNIKGMILNLGPFSARDARTAITHNISQSVFSDAVDILNEEAIRLDRKAKVHIKIDTGLVRVGVPYKIADAFVEKVAALSHIEIEGVLTAMTEDADFNPIQIERLNAVYNNAKEKGIDLGVRHAASSAEVDHDPGSHLDMVRPGSALVGLEPMPNMDIKPVLGVKTRVIYVKDMEPGDSIGYHQAYKIEKKMRVASLPLGYSDGFALSSVDKANVLIKGKKYPMIALITANHVSIDVTGSEDLEIGDVATIIGKDRDEEITNTEYSNQTGGHTYHTANCLKPYLTRLKV